MKGRSFLTLIVCAVIAASALAQTKYLVTDTGAGFGPDGINSACMLTGQGAGASYAWDPVNGLVVVPGLPGSGYSTTFDVNDGGTVCGLDPHAGVAILWDRVNGTRPLADFPSSSDAYGINNLGHVVGRYFTNVSIPFIWKPGQGWTTLSDPGYSAGANRVNASDQVLGFVEMVLNGPDLAVVWQPDGSITYLGNMGSQYENIPTDINDLGYVCGGTTGNTSSPAYLWNPNGTYTPIYNPFDQSAIVYPGELNNHNVVVGGTSDSSGAAAGFIWSQQSGLTIINDVLAPGSTQWDIWDAVSINDTGQIGAIARLNGVDHAVLLSPIPQNVVIPDSYFLYRGTLAGGVLYCLQFQDALYLAVHPGKTITAAEPPVQVQVSGTSPTTTPKSFQFTFTGHVNTPHLTEGILLYNFQTGAYELLNAQAATLSDSTVTVTPTGDLSRFVDPATKEVRARVTLIPNGQIVFAAWTASLGLTDWTVT